MPTKYGVLLWIALSLVWSPASPITIFAQVQTGRIVAVVVDPSGASVPGASITVTDVETNIPHATTSGTGGEYVVTPLGAGMYQVTIRKDGFQTVVCNRIELQVGQTAQIDVQLSLGDTNTMVEVTTQAPLIDTQSGTLGQVITAKQILDLPLNGRSYYELGRLTPGASLTPGLTSFVVRPNLESGMTISGVRGRQTMFIVDGMDVTDQHQGGTLVRTSVDALQEFKMREACRSSFGRSMSLWLCHS